MTITLRVAGTSSGATAAVDAVTPGVGVGGAFAGDITFLAVSMKPYTATMTTPAGWSKITEQVSGSVASAPDTGSVKVLLFYLVGAVAEGPVPALTQTGANSVAATIWTMAGTVGGWDVTAWHTGVQSPDATNYAVTSSAAMALTAGDYLIAVSAIDTDGGTQSAVVFGGTAGATQGAGAVSVFANCNTGDDTKSYCRSVAITAGSSSTAPTFAFSSTVVSAGVTIFLRIREAAGGAALTAAIPANTVGVTDTVIATITGVDIYSNTYSDTYDTAAGGGATLTVTVTDPVGVDDTPGEQVIDVIETNTDLAGVTDSVTVTVTNAGTTGAVTFTPDPAHPGLYFFTGLVEDPAHPGLYFIGSNGLVEDPAHPGLYFFEEVSDAQPPVPPMWITQRTSVTIDDAAGTDPEAKWIAWNAPDTPADSVGNDWILQTIDGWWGGLSPRANVVDRPFADGTVDGPAPQPGRTVTITGVLDAVDEAALMVGMDKLARVLAGDRRRGALIVKEDATGLLRTADVRLAGPTLVKRTGRLNADWSVSVYAADPARYGFVTHSRVMSPFLQGAGRTYPLTHNRVYPAVGSAGRVTVNNAGGRATPPVVTFNGPCTDPQMVGGTSTVGLWLRMTLLAGESVVLDAAARTVTYGGASRRAYLDATSQWFTLPPGNSVLIFTAAAGAGTATVTWRDAWA